jgi:hypothetical protein
MMWKVFRCWSLTAGSGHPASASWGRMVSFSNRNELPVCGTQRSGFAVGVAAPVHLPCQEERVCRLGVLTVEEENTVWGKP